MSRNQAKPEWAKCTEGSKKEITVASSPILEMTVTLNASEFVIREGDRTPQML